MTDQGFKKFRRRRKREDTPAADPLRSDASRVSPAQDLPADPGAPDIQQDPVAAPGDAAPSAPPREAAALSEPVNTKDDDSPPAKVVPKRPQSAAKSAPQPSVMPPPERSIPPIFQIEQEPALPAPLPDPWLVMRQVEITGLGRRRSRLPLVDYFRTSPTARAFDLLRTRMLHTLRDHGWKRVAICAPTAKCGASFTAANLALSLARVPGSRTVLMDMNLRNPGVAKSLGLERAALYSGDMPGFLRGELRLEDHLVAAGDSLALGLNTSACYNAAEVLHEATCAATITDMIRRTCADVVLFDMPPVLQNDDVAAFLPQVDGVLLVSDAEQTTARHLRACEKMLAGHTQLLGVVLNRARNGDGLNSTD
ncbi:CpsD/CapB family tyrosine-protein kinase [Epibacterium sp. Ofav1-8]|uniref:CpsD/CapB family tyrosine-protein kinase n=1 Tax=Epibacterium sp. Ofav1-8 TaxID=2917735 RepID=UPI001EF41871|nr:CpsD/CapB family tyrosine-protein kinase [Epibacterium sp. Ofav1-8]MCG7624728.1 exopolysaccharide biosynthesis protein [Epibacterium sp. Ofav1-8]